MSNHKNTVSNSSLEAGGNIHVGDIYHGTTPEAITLSKELQQLKTQLSLSHKKVLEESGTIGKLEEKEVLKIISKIGEVDLQQLLAFYKRVVQLPWRQTVSLTTALETIVHSTSINELVNLKSYLHPEMPIASKLRMLIPCLPALIAANEIEPQAPLMTLWKASI